MSKRATALPVTFLMLFVSFTLLISATYYFAVAKINVKGQLLKFSAAKQNMLALDYSIGFVTWSPGASKTYHFDDCGGALQVLPTTRRLIINVAEGSFSEVVLNYSVGKMLYELPVLESPVNCFFLRGDGRAIVNQSAVAMTQLYISIGENGPEIVLSYRPFVSSAFVGFSNGKPLNSLRIYVVNLNSSRTLRFNGSFYLKATCVNVTSSIKNYNFSNQISSLVVTADFGGVQSSVSVPITSNADGAIVNLEVVVCNIRLQQVEV